MIIVSLYFILAHALSIKAKQNSYCADLNSTSVTVIDNKHVSLNSGFNMAYIIHYTLQQSCVNVYTLMNTI